MKDGEIINFGSPEIVFTKEMLKKCFLLNGEIISDPFTNKPICVSYELLRKANK